MTDLEILDKLNSLLGEVDEMLTLGEMGLLKSDELHLTKNRIEDEIKSLKKHFGTIESRKIDKFMPLSRNMLKIGVFLDAHQVNHQLIPLSNLIQELIKTKGGSEKIEMVKLPELEITGSTINQAIKDAKILIETQGASSAVDRVHTVLHGYLKKICDNSNIPYSKDVTLNQLLIELKKKHIAFQNKNDNTESILKSMANIFDKLNPLRNSASLAHPNEELLNQDEAMLIINTVNTILSYLNLKIK